MDDSSNDNNVDYGSVDGSVVGGNNDADNGSIVDGNDCKVDDNNADNSYDGEEGKDGATSPSESGEEIPNAKKRWLTSISIQSLHAGRYLMGTYMGGMGTVGRCQPVPAILLVQSNQLWLLEHQTLWRHPSWNRMK
jgi:hypothetical protein